MIWFFCLPVKMSFRLSPSTIQTLTMALTYSLLLGGGTDMNYCDSSGVRHTMQLWTGGFGILWIVSEMERECLLGIACS